MLLGTQCSRVSALDSFANISHFSSSKLLYPLPFKHRTSPTPPSRCYFSRVQEFQSRNRKWKLLTVSTSDWTAPVSLFFCNNVPIILLGEVDVEMRIEQCITCLQTEKRTFKLFPFRLGLVDVSTKDFWLCHCLCQVYLKLWLFHLSQLETGPWPFYLFMFLCWCIAFT